MNRVISEIKARTNDLEAVRRYLESCGADYVGTDEQLDIYFQVDRGRLKLRRGSIENALIHYDRPNTNGMRESVVDLVKLPAASTDGVSSLPQQLESALRRALTVRVEVRKRRAIYFIGNVKFHLDLVDGLGQFVEIEAIGAESEVPHLREQCEQHRNNLGISSEDLVGVSYSDLLMQSGS